MKKIRIRDRAVKDDWDFPCYGISKDETAVVYFTKQEEGFCIATDTKAYTVGDICACWSMDLFTQIPKGKTIEIDT